MLTSARERVNQAKRRKISSDYCEQPDSGDTIGADIKFRGIEK
jgi:hypothetical protein